MLCHGQNNITTGLPESLVHHVFLLSPRFKEIWNFILDLFLFLPQMVEICSQQALDIGSNDAEFCGGVFSIYLCTKYHYDILQIHFILLLNVSTFDFYLGPFPLRHLNILLIDITNLVYTIFFSRDFKSSACRQELKSCLLSMILLSFLVISCLFAQDTGQCSI